MSEVKRTERGWAGHYCMAYACMFRRNTLLEYEGKRIVVSTIGNKIKDIFHPEKGSEEVGVGRHYETMAFWASESGAYIDADIRKEINFDSNWAISVDDTNCFYVDNLANDMHEAVVNEIATKLEKGEL